MKTFVLLLSFVAGCSTAGTGAANQAGKSSAAPNCLELVWESGRPTDKGFDVTNDRSGQNAISCSTLTTPSAFAHVLAEVKMAARNGDEAALSGFVEYPLVFIDESNRQHRLSKEQLVQSRHLVFREDVLQALSNVTLKDMQVVTNKGGFFNRGAIWLYVRDVGGEPSIAAVNHSALVPLR